MEGLGELLVGIAMVGNLIIAIYGIYTAHHASKLNMKNAETISQLEANTNSKLDQLMKVTGEAERAKGVLEGKQEK